LTGFVNVWLIVEPEPALAPVILPVMEPIVHVKVLEMLAVKLMFGLVPLQVLAVAVVVTTGDGLTVTVMIYAFPEHDPVVETGVTIYCTVPAVVLLGLVNVWLIVGPEPPLVPAMLPTIVPIVQLKLLGALAVKPMFVEAPLQIVFVAVVVIVGNGIIVIDAVAITTEHPALAAIV
jgi:hypothetical protein